MVCSGCGFTDHDTGTCPQRNSTTVATPDLSREGDNGTSRPPQFNTPPAGSALAQPCGEQPWIPVQCQASRHAQTRSGLRGQNRVRANGSLHQSSSTNPGNISRPVNHRPEQRGAAAHNGGSHFNVLENVEAQTEEMTHPGLQSHPFVFAGSGRRVELSSVVQAEPTAHQSGPSPTVEPTTVLLLDPILDDSKPSPLMDGVEASGLAVGVEIVALFTALSVPLNLIPAARSPVDLPIQQLDEAMGQAHIEVDIREEQQGGPTGASS
ncbi:hypothetical protein K2173_011847 [Erythroxylum novogranatense]|uniref:Uncharacterized protein n=1 Tax=Erythroxylum novogranatense TaxID=1862640 RepID=A0AAV8SM40_9ROSI|nr:hypothetical protein K2173_011847 [Erythroxylum novogranatense]